MAVLISSRALRVHCLSYTARAFSTTTSSKVDFTHAVIGGGVVGLAIARQLAGRDGTSTVLVERNRAVGMETSSRNSEVIHAGLYYGEDSLKTKLCIQGRQMMYALCKEHSIPHANTKKWIVAQSDQEWEDCLRLHEHAQRIGVPTRPISLEAGKLQEPDVRADKGILESESTGIVDGHALMEFLKGDFEDRGGDLALNSTVTSIESARQGKEGYEIFTRDRNTSETTSFTTSTLINSAGLGCFDISNMLLPPERHVQGHWCKGSYFSYSLSKPRTKTLIYPAPTPGQGGLGTHLTLDLAGQIRFGPDVEWVDSPDDLAPNDSQIEAAFGEIKRYLPGVRREALAPDYSGIRPKLARSDATASGKNFKDFVIRKEDGYDGFVNLLAIESPGLTSNLAIALKVEDLLYT